MMAKEPMITVRVTLEQHQAFKLACVRRGQSMSDVLRETIVGESVPYEYLRDCLGEVLHTAFRKGGQSKEADHIWHTIKAMPPDDWGRVLDWIVWCIQTSRSADAARQQQGGGEE